MKTWERDRRGIVASIAALGLVVLLGARAARAEDEPKAPADLAAKVDAYVKPLVDLGLFSGTVLVARGGDVLVEKAYGPADVASGIANTTSTQYKLMSVTKCITAVGVMRLVQAGRIGLEDPVAKHLPDWPAGWKDVTVHQLLDHTSGIPNLEVAWAAAARQSAERGLTLWKAQAPQLGQQALASTPGARSRYSNFNHVLLGLLIEAASGKPYPSYMKAAVFDRAKMSKTGFDDGTRRAGLSIGYFRGKEGKPDVSAQDMSTIRAAGDIYSTAADLHRLDRALHGDAILDAATRKTMWTPTAAGGQYACGWQVAPVHGRACVRHSGGANGYVADFLRFPEEDACVVALSNFAFAPVGRIALDLASMLFGARYEAPKAVTDKALDACVGLYRPAGQDGLAAWVRRSGRTLLVTQVRAGVPRCGGNLLIPLADDRYLLPWGGTAVRFTEATDGRFAKARFAAYMPAFDRVAEPVDAWEDTVGAYGGTSAAPDVRLAREQGRFLLRDAERGNIALPLVPLTDSLALVAYTESFGTLLRVERDADGKAVRLRWQRNDGSKLDAPRH
jgi:CubicO group peptidase (beta-lactamase class C family)